MERYQRRYIKPKLESKEGLLNIKKEKKYSLSVKRKIEIEVKPEMKEEPLYIKEEPLDIKEEALDIKEEPLDIKEEALDIKAEAVDIKEEAVDIRKEHLEIKGEIDNQLQTGVYVFETLDGKKRYKCSICKKDFGTTDRLKLHVSAFHEEIFLKGVHVQKKISNV